MLHIKKKPTHLSFRYCLDLYVIRDKNCIGYCCQSPSSLADKLKIAFEAGYEGVELWHRDVKGYCEKHGVDQLRELLRQYKLTVPSYKVIEHWPDTEPMKLAAQIGAKSCIVKTIRDQYTGPKPTLEEMTKSYRELLEIGDELNIDPALEFMVLAPAYNNLEETIELVNSASHPRAKYVLDTWHLWRNDNAQFENLPTEKIDASQISVVHFTDARNDVPRENQVDGDRKMPGDGLLNLSRFCTILKDKRFNGWLSLNVYDRSLWDLDPMQVATEGYYKMVREAERESFERLADSNTWANRQKQRCEGLWVKQYLTHLDPRIKETDRTAKLEEILQSSLEGVVLDYKCGFSPLAHHVDIGFDAFPGCIEYLKKVYPEARWMCMSDVEFAEQFDEPIDVLMHLGLGDSITEVDSHLITRNKCKPKIIIIECAATSDGKVDESKPGHRARWEKLKEGLEGEEHFYETNMKERCYRLIFIGKPIQQ